MLKLNDARVLWRIALKARRARRNPGHLRSPLRAKRQIPSPIQRKNSLQPCHHPSYVCQGHVASMPNTNRNSCPCNLSLRPRTIHSCFIASVLIGVQQPLDKLNIVTDAEDGRSIFPTFWMGTCCRPAAVGERLPQLSNAVST